MHLKIRHKLFLAILIANILVVLSIYLLGNWIFSTSFREYLDATEANRLAPLTEELADIYEERGSWHWVMNRQDRTWHELMQEYSLNRPTGPDRRPPDAERRPPLQGDQQRRPPPPRKGNLLTIQPGFMLQDNINQLVIGREADVDKAYWMPIEVQDSIVGYLGFMRRLNIGSELDNLFIDRIKNNFVWMAFGVLLISSLISVPLARRLVRPLENLRLAADKLASGDYQISLNHDSHDEIGQLTRDFNSLAKTLAKNLSARQQWIADISHELRTPVAILQGEIEAVQDGVRTLNLKTINSLHHEILRLSRLVNDLHELSLSDMGALSYQRKVLDLVALIENVLDQHRGDFDQQNLIINCHSSHSSIEISADYQRLQQLFTNLAINSRHYTQSPGQLVVEITKALDKIIVRWSDSAPGETDSELGKLFDRLYRAEASRNRNSGGSGLGLAICKNIVEASLGSITAEHADLGGITIVITFPLTQTRDTL